MVYDGVGSGYIYTVYEPGVTFSANVVCRLFYSINASSAYASKLPIHKGEKMVNG